MQYSNLTAQGGIYSLHRPNGHPSNSVLKVMYKTSLASIAGMADVEREWEVGRRLNFLAEADGSLPGVACLPCPSSSQGPISGNLLIIFWGGDSYCLQAMFNPHISQHLEQDCCREGFGQDG